MRLRPTKVPPAQLYLPTTIEIPFARANWRFSNALHISSPPGRLNPGNVKRKFRFVCVNLPSIRGSHTSVVCEKSICAQCKCLGDTLKLLCDPTRTRKLRVFVSIRWEKIPLFIRRYSRSVCTKSNFALRPFFWSNRRDQSIVWHLKVFNLFLYSMTTTRIKRIKEISPPPTYVHRACRTEKREIKIRNVRLKVNLTKFRWNYRFVSTCILFIYLRKSPGF